MLQYGISPERFQENRDLCQFFKILTTSADEDNKVLKEVSCSIVTLESRYFQRNSKVPFPLKQFSFIQCSSLISGLRFHSSCT